MVEMEKERRLKNLGGIVLRSMAAITAFPDDEFMTAQEHATSITIDGVIWTIKVERGSTPAS